MKAPLLLLFAQVAALFAVWCVALLLYGLFRLLVLPAILLLLFLYARERRPGRVHPADLLAARLA